MALQRTAAQLTSAGYNQSQGFFGRAQLWENDSASVPYVLRDDVTNNVWRAPDPVVEDGSEVLLGRLDTLFWIDDLLGQLQRAATNIAPATLRTAFRAYNIAQFTDVSAGDLT